MNKCPEKIYRDTAFQSWDYSRLLVMLSMMVLTLNRFKPIGFFTYEASLFNFRKRHSLNEFLIVAQRCVTSLVFFIRKTNSMFVCDHAGA